jgi:hypothetical protein
MTVTVRLMTLSGKFTVLREVECADMAAALTTVQAHAATGGYTNVKPIDNIDSIRYTARTPGGRGGRNIAYLDWPQ